MKKILLLINILLFCSVTKVSAVELPEKTDGIPVKVYLFYQPTCGHCHDFLQYFTDNYTKEYEDYFEIVTINVFDGDHAEIMQDLQEELDVNEIYIGSVPFIIIGDYNRVGFISSTGPAIINQALIQYEKEDYKDLVRQYLREEDKSITTGTLKETASSLGITKSNQNTISGSEEATATEIIAIIAVFAIVIGLFGGLFILARKK